MGLSSQGRSNVKVQGLHPGHTASHQPEQHVLIVGGTQEKRKNTDVWGWFCIYKNRVRMWLFGACPVKQAEEPHLTPG